MVLFKRGSNQLFYRDRILQHGNKYVKKFQQSAQIGMMLKVVITLLLEYSERPICQATSVVFAQIYYTYTKIILSTPVRCFSPIYEEFPRTRTFPLKKLRALSSPFHYVTICEKFPTPPDVCCFFPDFRRQH